MYSNIPRNKRRHKYLSTLYCDIVYNIDKYDIYPNIDSINDIKSPVIIDTYEKNDITSFILTICVVVLLCIPQFTNLHRLSHS